MLIGLAVWAAVNPRTTTEEKPISEVVKMANAGDIAKITIQGNEVMATKKGQTTPSIRSTKEDGSTIYEQGLQEGKTTVDVKPVSDTGSMLWTILGTVVLPVLLIGGLFMFMMRQAQGQNNQAMGFGKSKAKLYGLDKERVTFADIAGMKIQNRTSKKL